MAIIKISKISNAIELNDLGVLKELIGKGNINSPIYTIENCTEYYYTPLFLALEKHHFEIADFLLSFGANINQELPGDMSYLVCAANSGDLEVAKYLLKNGIEVNSKNSEGYTALDRVKARDKVFINYLRKFGGKGSNELRD